MGRQLRDLAPAGFARRELTARVELHPERFAEYLTATYGHDRLSSVVPRGVFGWRDHLAGGLGPSTVNHHLASVSGFLAWVVAQGCGALPERNPAAGVRTLVLPPPEPGRSARPRPDP